MSKRNQVSQHRVLWVHDSLCFVVVIEYCLEVSTRKNLADHLWTIFVNFNAHENTGVFGGFGRRIKIFDDSSTYG